jgi:hypothetical protein
MPLAYATGLTILTSFKPFVAGDRLRQINALASWLALDMDVEVVAFGETPGFDAIAAQHGVQHVRDIPAFEGRLPRVDQVMAYGEQHGKHDLQVYVNGDIVIFEDFAEALRSIKFRRFVMVGQRMDVDVDEPLPVADAAQRGQVKEGLFASGRWHDIGGMDYFAWRRGSLPKLPPLYLGAAGWDNIVVYCCRQAGVPVVDGTRDIKVFHQNHEHHRLETGGRAAYEGPAAKLNLAQVADPMCRFYTTDASHWLDGGQVKSAYASPRHVWRMILTYPIVRGWPAGLRWPFRIAAGITRRVGTAFLAGPG